MQRLVWLVLAGLSIASLAYAAGDGQFVGRVTVEWLDDQSAHQRLKVLEDFSFEAIGGKRWVVAKDAQLDGLSMPPAFRSLVGEPFTGPHRRAALLHDYFSTQREAPWREVRRIFFNAARAGGVDEVDAKVMYMAVYAEAPRWEPRGSSCFQHCHAARPELVWRPVVTENDLRAVVEWIDRDNPALDAIDAKVDAVTRRPGPHLFGQGHEPTGQ